MQAWWLCLPTSCSRHSRLVLCYIQSTRLPLHRSPRAKGLSVYGSHILQSVPMYRERSFDCRRNGLPPLQVIVFCSETFCFPEACQPQKNLSLFRTGCSGCGHSRKLRKAMDRKGRRGVLCFSRDLTSKRTLLL